MSRTTIIENWNLYRIISSKNTLGVPHFQRGLVWNDTNTAMLLESLYFGTPCGNIVLWKNPDKKNTAKHGIPLFKSEESVEYFIIDGQQRTRSLCSVFDEINRRPQMDGDEVPYVWAANLFAFAEVFAQEDKKFKDLFPKRKIETLFVKVKDPALQKQKYIEHIIEKINNGTRGKNLSPEYQNQYNFIPLSILFNETGNLENISFNNYTDIKDAYNPKGIEKLQAILNKIKQDSEKNTIFIKLNEQEKSVFLIEFFKKLQSTLKNILSREFPVHILTTENMSDIIHTYIRINSGGRAVQQEEKTIARLVQLCPENTGKGGTFSFIRDLFNEIHPDEGSDNINDHFKRAKENQFGFRLFVRVFVMAANYHTGSAIGSQSMSFSAIEGNEQLEVASENEIAKIWAVVKEVTLAVKELLENELHFDTLAFLPDSRSLWPIFMILIKHPNFIENNKIKEEFRKHFAYILLILLLGAGDSEKTIVGLMKNIREFSGDGNSLLANFIVSDINADDNKYSVKLKEAWKRITSNCTKNNLMSNLALANAMNNRYILLLYALERHRGCEDFYGKALPEKLQGKFSSGRRISVDLIPEKQHIVPYSALHSNNDDAELYKGRLSNDPANNIGNLTYISRDLNHYETGLGAEWLIINQENAGHIISTAAVERFNEIPRTAELSVNNECYQNWTARRREDIADAFCCWLEELKNSVTENTTIIPHARLLILPSQDKNGKTEFKWLAYLAEVWQIPNIEVNERIELAEKFEIAGQKLLLDCNGVYKFSGKTKK